MISSSTVNKQLVDLSMRIPLSLYVHIPWCIKKCPYCDFNSYAAQNLLPEEEYISALTVDLKEDLHYVQNRPIKSIFFGGGTPSLFSPASIGKIIDNIASHVNFVPNIEITLEANPGTMEYKDFRDYRTAGINRVSLGAQSFQDDKLKTLGRVHKSAEIRKALGTILKADFNSFNIDLMYGLPNQTLEDLEFDINTALTFNPPHLSWYNLNIEPNTLFFHKPPLLPDQDQLWFMHQRGENILENSGLKRYEVSAFSNVGLECQHNLNYWQFGDYLGIGAGAHGKITDLNNQIIIRYTKKRYPKDYLKNLHQFVAEKKVVKNNDILFEFMLNALRLAKGVNLDILQNRTHLSSASVYPIIEKLTKKGLLDFCDNTKIIKPTPLGYRFLNDLVSEFLP